MKLKHFVLSLFIVLAVLMSYCYIFYGHCLFFARFLWRPQQTGSVVPTSQTAAQELIKPMLKKQGPRTILEIGAGTGPVTQVIVKQLEPNDRFDVLELDPMLCDLLKKKFKQYRQLAIYCMPIEQWDPGYQYDVIISTVPLTNLTPDQIKLILNQFEHLAKPQAVLSYLEYMWGTEIKQLLTRNQQAKKEKEKALLLKQFRDKHKTETVSVMANVPPTYVHHLKMGT